MKPNRAARLVPALVALLLPLAPGAGRAQARDTSLEARVARIERDLLPPLRIRGRADTAATLREQMARYKVPAVSVAVIDGGRIAWARAWGMADVETGRAATPATRFQAASVSKAVTATAALRLVEEGVLSLDDSVNARLRSWKVPPHPWSATKPVTLRGILTHTAGLSTRSYPGYARGAPLPTILQVLAGAPPANTAPVVVDTEPGTLWRYSGGGTMVMQLLLMDVTGEAFPALMHARVLEPLGMESSTFENPLPDSLHGVAATGYRADGTPVDGQWRVQPEMAAGGLWSTPSDLARWLIGLQRAYAGEPGALLSRGMTEAMLTRGLGAWGLGPELAGAGDSLRFGHTGNNEGFNVEAWSLATGGRGVVVMINGDAGTPLVREVVAAVAREYGWPTWERRELVPLALGPRALGAYAGRYAQEGAEVTPERTLVVEVFGEWIRLVLSNGQTYEMVPIAADTFAHARDGWEIRFERGSDGGVTVLASSNGARLTRISPADGQPRPD